MAGTTPVFTYQVSNLGVNPLKDDINIRDDAATDINR